jgi:hypothetical protein
MKHNAELGRFTKPSVFEASLTGEHHGGSRFVAGLDALVVV